MLKLAWHVKHFPSKLVAVISSASTVLLILRSLSVFLSQCWWVLRSGRKESLRFAWRTGGP